MPGEKKKAQDWIRRQWLKVKERKRGLQRKMKRNGQRDGKLTENRVSMKQGAEGQRGKGRTEWLPSYTLMRDSFQSSQQQKCISFRFDVYHLSNFVCSPYVHVFPAHLQKWLLISKSGTLSNSHPLKKSLSSFFLSEFWFSLNSPHHFYDSFYFASTCRHYNLQKSPLPKCKNYFECSLSSFENYPCSFKNLLALHLQCIWIAIL